MTINKQDLGGLVRLQEQDKLLDSISASIIKIPEQIQSLRTQLEEAQHVLAELKDKATKFQIQRKEKEIELGQKEEAVRKHSQELNKVKTNEAFKALQSEIDKAKADASNLETEILTLMEESDRLTQEEKAQRAELGVFDAKIQEQIKALEAQKAELESRHVSAKSERETQAQHIPAALLSEYEQIRKRRQGIAMAKVHGNICVVCHMTLRPQSLVNLAKGTSLVTCDSCQRILYQPNLITEAAKPL